MIHLFAHIQNPWHNQDRWPWCELVQASWVITKNKTLDLCLDFYPSTLFNLNLDARWWGQDHAGPELCIGVLGLGFSIGLHDRRHWNYENNSWLIHD